MATEQWECVLIDWVNCLKLQEATIANLDQLRSEKFLHNLTKLINNDKIHCNPDDVLTGIFNIISCHYPKVKFTEQENIHIIDLPHQDLVNLTSLLMHYTCIQDRRNALTSPLCHSLNMKVQWNIRRFLELVTTEVTAEDLEGILKEVSTNSNKARLSCDLIPVIESPKSFKSPLQDLLKTPITKGGRLQEKERQIFRLKSELEAEISEKVAFEAKLNEQEVKIKKLEHQLDQKRSQITFLEFELEKSDQKKNKKTDAHTEKYLKTEIESLELYAKKCDKENLDLQQERDILIDKANKWKTNCEMWEARCVESQEWIEECNEKYKLVEVKNLSLETQCKELRNLLDELKGENLSLDESQQWEAYKKRTSSNFGSGNLAQEVVQVQLIETEKKLIDLTEELKKLAEEKSLALNKLGETEDILENTTSELQNVKLKEQEILNRTQLLSEELKILQEKNTILDEKNLELLQKCSATSENLKTITLENKSINFYLEDTLKQLEDAEGKLAKKVKQLKNISNTLKEISTDRNKIKKEFEDLLEEKLNIQTTLSICEQDLKKSSQERQELIQKLEENALELNNLKKQELYYIKIIDSSQTELNRYKETIETFNNASQANASELIELKNKNDLLGKELANVLNHLGDATRQFKKEIDSEKVNYLIDIEQIKTQLVNTENDKQILSKTLEKTIEELEKIKIEFVCKNNEFEKINEKLLRTEQAALVTSNFLDLNTEELHVVHEEKEKILEALAMSNRDKLELDAKNGDLLKKNAMLEDSLNRFREVSKDLEKTLKAKEFLELKLQDMELKCVQQLEKTARLGTTIKEKEEVLNKLNSTLNTYEEIKNEKNKLTEKYENLQIKFVELEDAAEILKRDSRQLIIVQQENEIFKEKYQILQLSHEEVLSKNKGHQEELLKNSNTLKDLQKISLEREETAKKLCFALDETEKYKVKLEEKNEEFQAKVADLNSVSERLEGVTIKLNSALQNEEILKDKVQQLLGNNEELQIKLDKLKDDSGILKTDSCQLVILQQENEILTEKYQVLQLSYEEVLSKNEQLNKEHQEELQKNSNTLKDYQKISLEREKTAEKLCLALEETEKYKIKVEEKNEELEVKITELNDISERLEEVSIKLNNALQNEEILKDKVVSFELTQQQLQKNYEELQLRLEELRNNSEDLKERSLSLESVLQENQLLREKVQAMEITHQELLDTEAQLHQDHQKMLKDKSEILENLQKLIKEKEQLFRELGGLSSQLGMVKKENAAILSDYQDLQNQQESLQLENDELNQVLEEKKKHLENSKEHVEKLEKEYKNLENQIQELQLEKADITKEKQDVYDHWQQSIEEKEKIMLERDKYESDNNLLFKEREGLLEKLQSISEENQKLAISFELSQNEILKIKKDRNQILKSQTEVMKETESNIIRAHEVAVEEKKELTKKIKNLESELENVRKAYSKVVTASSQHEIENNKLRTIIDERNTEIRKFTHVKEAYEKLLGENTKQSSELEIMKRKRAKDREEFLELLKKGDVKNIQIQSEYEQKLEKMKEKMLELYKKEVQREISKLQQEKHFETLNLQKVIDDLKSQIHESKGKTLSVEDASFKDAASFFLTEQRNVRQGLSSFRGRGNKVADRDSLIRSTGTLSKPLLAGSNKEQNFKSITCLENADSVDRNAKEKRTYTLPPKFKPEDINEERRRRNTPVNTVGQNLHMEDEEDDVFNEKYLIDLKEGRCMSALNLTERESNRGERLSQLAWRNSLVPPHLKSSYSVELQFVSPTKAKEDDIKSGNLEFDDSHCKLLPGEKQRQKKDFGTTSYKKPGPPTPSKNGGRPSLQGNEILPLKELNRPQSATPKRSTPNRLKLLFKGFNKENNNANTENSTPKAPKRLSFFKNRR